MIKHLLYLFIFSLKSQIIPILYQSNNNVIEWNSNHWNNSIEREIISRDEYDITTLSQKRGNGKLLIKGNGILEMSGSQPRFYLNNQGVFYKNMEITVYYKRTGTDGIDWSGLIVGSRSSPNGHSLPSTNYEYSHTYYARIRHDGQVDFSKELTHPKSEYWWNGINKHGKLFNGQLHEGIWYGMKFILYNLDNTRVKMELYIDRTSNGEDDKLNDINNWEKLGEVIDDGNWPVPIRSEFEEIVDKNTVITQGGVCFIRNTGIEKAEYKYFSVREILIPIQNSSSYKNCNIFISLLLLLLFLLCN